MKHSETSATTLRKSNGLARVNDRQMKAITMLCSGYGKKEVAEHIGVSRATLWRWLQNPSVVSVYEELREGTFKNAQLSLDLGTDVAAETIVELARDCNNPAVRLAAARFLIERRSDVRLYRECELG